MILRVLQRWPVMLFFIGMLLACPDDNRNITFRVIPKSLPDSAFIYITGNQPELGGWRPGKINLEKQSNGDWQKTFSFPAGTHLEFKFTLGSWEWEALNADGSASGNHLLDVKNDTILVFEIPTWNEAGFRPVGKITGNVQYHRDMPGEGIKPRDVIVWLPPGYEEEPQTQHYPALYMHDGQNIFDPSTSFLGRDWQVDEVADSLIRAGAMREIIIVGVYNTVNRAAEYSDTTAGRAYMNFLAHTLKPFIDSNYRTLPGPEYTATMGSSMGGLISFLIAWHHPEVFSQAGCLSPAFIFQNYKSVKMVNAYRGPAKPIRIYMDNGGVGLEDTLQYGCDKMLAALRQAGFKDGDNLEWFYDETAEHNEAAWAKRVWRPLLFLYGLKNKK